MRYKTPESEKKNREFYFRWNSRLERNVILTPIYIHNYLRITANCIWKSTSHLFAHYAHCLVRHYLTEKRFSGSYLIDSHSPNRLPTFYRADIPAAAPLCKRKSYATASNFPRALRDPQQFLAGSRNYLALSIKYICKQKKTFRKSDIYRSRFHYVHFLFPIFL